MNKRQITVKLLEYLITAMVCVVGVLLSGVLLWLAYCFLEWRDADNPHMWLAIRAAVLLCVAGALTAGFTYEVIDKPAAGK